jgi:hypothetical protein
MIFQVFIGLLQALLHAAELALAALFDLLGALRIAPQNVAPVTHMARELRMRPFGLFNLASGLFMLLASVICGGAVGNVWSGNYVLRGSRIFALLLGHADVARAVGSRGEMCW